VDPKRIPRDHQRVTSSRSCIAIVITAALGVPTHARAEEPVAADNEAAWAAVEAPAAPEDAPAAKPGPPPASPEIDRLHDRGEQGERIAIAGYVFVAIGGLALLIGVPPLIAGNIEENKEENFFQEAGDPESARRKKQLGAGLMLTGLGVALVGGSLLTVGLVRKKRAENEIQRRLAQPTASLAPWFGGRGGGLALSARF
jgi:hypothetical protein